MSCSQNSLRIIESGSFPIKYFIPSIYTDIGSSYQALGDLDEAEVFYTKALEKYRDPEAKRSICAGLFFVALILLLKGDLVSARRLYQEALFSAEENARKNWQISCLRGLGMTEDLLGNSREAERSFVAAKEISAKLQSPVLHFYSLFSLAKFFTEKERLGEAEEVLKQMLSLRQEIQSPTADIDFGLLRALIDEKTGSLQTKWEALKAFRDLSINDSAQMTVRITAIVHTCMLLIEQFRIFGDGDSLKEVAKLSEGIFAYCEKSGFAREAIANKILQADINLLEGNHEKCDALLQTAMSDADAKGYRNLADIANTKLQSLRSTDESGRLIEIVDSLDLVCKMLELQTHLQRER